MRERLRQWLFGRWRTIHATGVDFGGAVGDVGYICVYRGLWRRPISVVVDRDGPVALAEMIRDGEVSDAG